MWQDSGAASPQPVDSTVAGAAGTHGALVSSVSERAGTREVRGALGSRRSNSDTGRRH